MEYANELIVAQEDVASKLDMVETAINKRNDMLPDLFNAANGNNGQIGELNTEINALKKEIQSTSGTERFELQAELDEKISKAKELIQKEADPSTIETILVQIEGAENRIMFEKKSYNDAVKKYNILVKQNPDEADGFELESYYNAN